MGFMVRIAPPTWAGNHDADAGPWDRSCAPRSYSSFADLSKTRPRRLTGSSVASPALALRW